jgi:hypothetical protein
MNVHEEGACDITAHGVLIIEPLCSSEVSDYSLVRSEQERLRDMAE